MSVSISTNRGWCVAVHTACTQGIRGGEGKAVGHDGLLGEAPEALAAARSFDHEGNARRTFRQETAHGLDGSANETFATDPTASTVNTQAARRARATTDTLRSAGSVCLCAEQTVRFARSPRGMDVSPLPPPTRPSSHRGAAGPAAPPLARRYRNCTSTR
jgi:hypothetical protein